MNPYIHVFCYKWMNLVGDLILNVCMVYNYIKFSCYINKHVFVILLILG